MLTSHELTNQTLKLTTGMFLALANFLMCCLSGLNTSGKDGCRAIMPTCSVMTKNSLCNIDSIIFEFYDVAESEKVETESKDGCK